MPGRYSADRSSGYPEPEDLRAVPQRYHSERQTSPGRGRQRSSPSRSSPSRSRQRSPHRTRRAATPPRGDGYASSVLSDAASSVPSLQGLRKQQDARSRRSPARDDLRVRAAEWMAHEFPGQTAQQVAQQLTGGGTRPQSYNRGLARGDRFTAARLAAAQPRIDRPHVAAAPYTPSVASDTDQLAVGGTAFQVTGGAPAAGSRDQAGPGGARCAYCGVSVPLTQLASHMQTGCPARPPAVGVASATDRATAGAGVALTPQAYRARAMEEVTRWLEASGLAEHATRFAELGFDDLPYLLRGAHGQGLDQAEIRQLVADVGMTSVDEQKLRDALRGGHVPASGVAGTAAARDSTIADVHHDPTADSVPRWLEKLNLGQYAARFAANGYDSLEYIMHKMSDAEVQQLIEDCVMPHGHAQRLRNAIRSGDSFQLGRAAPTAATAAVARMFNHDEDSQESSVVGGSKMNALRKQLDEASGQLTDLSNAWDELAEEKRLIEMKLRAEFEERMEESERASMLRIAEAERAREDAERALHEQHVELELAIADKDSETKARENLEKQMREREDAAQRTREALIKAEEKERRARLHEEEEVSRRQDAERLARERSEASRMALLREEAEKKSRLDAERKANESEAAMHAQKEVALRERAAREAAESVTARMQEAERAARAGASAEREKRLRFERSVKEKTAAEREALALSAQHERAREEAENQMRMQVETAHRARVEAERKMRQWQDASLASNAEKEREREQREELEIRVQELTRREEEIRTEMEDAIRQERERHRSGVDTIRGQLEMEQEERRRVQQVASQAIEREQQLRQTDPANLIFDTLDTNKDGQLTKREFLAGMAALR